MAFDEIVIEGPTSETENLSIALIYNNGELVGGGAIDIEYYRNLWFNRE